MTRQEKTVDLDSLPEVLPIFPLAGVLLLPHAQLPLNIFEKRYLAMSRDALAGHRLIGMVQPVHPEEEDTALPAVYGSGCAGRITAFQEIEDGRYLVTLTGMQRFAVKNELEPKCGYRRVEADWTPYQSDTTRTNCLEVDRDRLKNLLKDYFHKTGLSCEWELLDETPDRHLMTALAMICPFSAQEKQALLEAKDCQARAELFIELLDMAIKDSVAVAQGTSFH